MKTRLILQYLMMQCALLIGSATAQVSWHTLAGPPFEPEEYILYSISCAGDNCAACGQVQGSVTYQNLVLLSSDRGTTWHEHRFKDHLDWGYGLSQVQQIDANNIVVAGDNGILFRSTNAGKDWQLQQRTDRLIHSVHFADSLTGIFTARNDTDVYFTSDAGEHWIASPFHIPYGQKAHAYGGGMFRVFKTTFGPLYTTRDYWQTVDSTEELFHPGADSLNRILRYFTFGSGDTMIAHGAVNQSSAIFYRTTDAGRNWTASRPFTQYEMGGVRAVTSPDFDTIYAGGDLWSQRILLSTDNGVTWRSDSIFFDFDYSSTSVFGLARLYNGEVLGIFGATQFLNHSIIASTGTSSSKVETWERIVWNTHLYPNPVRERLTIQSVDSKREVKLIDMLGRVVMLGKLSEQGTITLDVSALARGVYSALIDHDGRLIPVGKVAVVR